MPQQAYGYGIFLAPLLLKLCHKKTSFRQWPSHQASDAVSQTQRGLWMACPADKWSSSLIYWTCIHRRSDMNDTCGSHHDETFCRQKCSDLHFSTRKHRLLLSCIAASHSGGVPGLRVASNLSATSGLAPSRGHGRASLDSFGLIAVQEGQEIQSAAKAPPHA